MIDTHTHMYFPDYGEKIAELVKRCQESGITALVLPNVDEESLPQMKDFHKNYPNYTFMAIGLHPTGVKEDWERVIEDMERELQSGDYVAVGEVGMDLYWNTTTKDIQKSAFEKQLRIAELHNLPVIIHSRVALEETLEIISKVKPTVPLVFHSFTGSMDDVKRIREVCNPWFGINGVVTYKNAPELREALQEIGIGKILLETDSPYLTPVPHRGKPNNSSYLVHVCEKVAECLEMLASKVEKETDKNAKMIFRI